MLIRARSLRAVGRWRAGLFWGRDWAVADLSEAQIEALENDRAIEVEIIDRAPPGTPAVADVQPSPVVEKPPVMFADPLLRERQEELLRGREELRRAEAGKAFKDLPPPDLGKSNDPEIKPSELVVDTAKPTKGDPKKPEKKQ